MSLKPKLYDNKILEKIKSEEYELMNHINEKNDKYNKFIMKYYKIIIIIILISGFLLYRYNMVCNKKRKNEKNKKQRK
jgi:hypothetical protein